MWTFETFAPVQDFGAFDYQVDEAAFDRWVALYPDDAAHRPLVPSGMAVAVMMRAYMALLQPRPPGNIHAGQHLHIHRLARIGDTMTTSLACIAKELRKERRWVTFETETRDAAGELLFTGRLTSIWAQ